MPEATSSVSSVRMPGLVPGETRPRPPTLFTLPLPSTAPPLRSTAVVE
jgi:hypothetical protein